MSNNVLLTSGALSLQVLGTLHKTKGFPAPLTITQVELLYLEMPCNARRIHSRSQAGTLAGSYSGVDVVPYQYFYLSITPPCLLKLLLPAAESREKNGFIQPSLWSVITRAVKRWRDGLAGLSRSCCSPVKIMTTIWITTNKWTEQMCQVSTELHHVGGEKAKLRFWRKMLAKYWLIRDGEGNMLILGQNKGTKLEVPGLCEVTTQLSTQAFWRDQGLVLSGWSTNRRKVGEGRVQSEAQDIPWRLSYRATWLAFIKSTGNVARNRPWCWQGWADGESVLR